MTTDRVEFVLLVHRFRQGFDSEPERDEILDRLVRALPHPRLMSLIRDRSLSDTQVIERAFEYQGIRLGPGGSCDDK
jgi:hypothetical protein